MKIIEKTKEFGKKHKKTIKGVAMTVTTAACVGGAYALGVRNTNTKWSDVLNKAAFEGAVRLTHRSTGDSYKLIMEKVVEEVVEVAEA